MLRALAIGILISTGWSEVYAQQNSKDQTMEIDQSLVDFGNNFIKEYARSIHMIPVPEFNLKRMEITDKRKFTSECRNVYWISVPSNPLAIHPYTLYLCRPSDSSGIFLVRSGGFGGVDQVIFGPLD